MAEKRYEIKVLMVDSIESFAECPAGQRTLLRTSQGLQEVCEDLRFCVVAAARTATIYKSLRKGAVIDADGYEW